MRYECDVHVMMHVMMCVSIVYAEHNRINSLKTMSFQQFAEVRAGEHASIIVYMWMHENNEATHVVHASCHVR